jgi:hypothetical protein
MNFMQMAYDKWKEPKAKRKVEGIPGRMTVGRYFQGAGRLFSGDYKCVIKGS